jgi:tetratricopeptide (TPR) repeat protein
MEADNAAAASAVAAQIGTDIYTTLSVPDLNSVARQTSDPGLLDIEAKRFIDHGLELASRRGGSDLDRSIALLRQAVELQPNSSAAHAGLATAFSYKAAYQSSSAPVEEGLEHARKAVALDAANPSAHGMVAALLYHTGALQQSIDAAFVALEHSPVSRRLASLLCNGYKRIGRPDKALLWSEVSRLASRGAEARDSADADAFAYLVDDERAEMLYKQYLKLHPEQPGGWMGITRLRLLHGKFDDARALYRREGAGFSDFSYAAQMAAQVEFFSRNFAEAEKLYTRLYEKDPSGGGAFYGAVSYESALGRMKMDSDPSAGRELLQRALRSELEFVASGSDDPTPLYRAAAIHASLGEIDSAVAHLRAAFDAGWIDYRSAAVDPRFDTVRSHPAYLQIEQEMSSRVASLRAAALAALSHDPLRTNERIR